MWKLYKLSFNRVHFGNGQLSDSAYSFSANRLFSALILEALKIDEDTAKKIYTFCNGNEFAMSDALPIKNDVIYLPKPIIEVNTNENDLATYSQKKKVKKIKFIPHSLYEDYVEGNFNLSDNNFGKLSTDIKNSIPRDTTIDTEPFEVGVYSLEKNIKLGVIVHFPDGSLNIELFEKLLKGLESSGLGGKRSSGLGKFELEIVDVPTDLANNLVYSDFDNNDNCKYILLTSAIHEKLVVSQNNDNNDDVLEGSKYLLKKISGFIYDGISSNQDPIRKNDLYVFEIGSSFLKCFKGVIQDVRPDNYEHPVYVFAKPLFYKIRSNDEI